MKVFKYIWMLSIIALFFWACEEEVALDAVSIFPADATINKGDTQQFSATVTDVNGDTVSDATVEWASSDELVATVDEAGLATGVDAGDAAITATADGVSGTASLTVEFSLLDIIPGTWDVVGMEQALLLTTNSTQTAFNMFVKGEGAVSVTGDYTAELTYMFGGESDENETVFNLTEESIWDSDEGALLPMLIIHEIQGETSGMLLVAETSLGDTIFYHVEPAVYDYDASTGILTVPETALLEMETGASSITVSGTLGYTTFDVPAYTATKVDLPFRAEGEESEEITVTFTAEGGFSRVSTSTYEGETEMETGEGSWELESDSCLLIIETYTKSDEPGEMTDTFVICFNMISEDIVNAYFEGNLCEEDVGGDKEYESEAECLADHEQMFALDEGSLVVVTSRDSMVFERQGGSSLARTGHSMGWKRNGDLKSVLRSLKTAYPIR